MPKKGVSPFIFLIAVFYTPDYLLGSPDKDIGDIPIWFIALSPLSPLLIPASLILHFLGVRIEAREFNKTFHAVS